MGSGQSSSRDGSTSRVARELERAMEARLRLHEQQMQTRVHQSRVTITNVRAPSTDEEAASKKDLEKSLEEQRKVYEQKIKNLIENQKGATSTSVTPESDASSKRDLEKALEEQRKMYEVKMKNLVESQQIKASPSVQAGPVLQQPPRQQASVHQPMQQHHAAFQQAAVQQTAAQQAVQRAQRAQEAAIAAEQWKASKQTAAQQPASQQIAAQQAAIQQAAAAQQAAIQQAAAAQQAAIQQAAAQQAAIKQAAAQHANAQQAAAQRAAVQQTAEQQAAAQRQATIQAIAVESVKKMQNEGFTLRQTLDYSINHLYPQLTAINNQQTPSPKPATPQQKNFKGGPQNVQKSHPNKGEEDDIICPTCQRRYGDRIYNCGHGHSICHLCLAQQVRCSSCRQLPTNTRNTPLEKYVAERKVKCPNADDGCRLFIKMTNLAAHKKECPFKEMECPCLGPCHWTGKLPNLVDHFDKKHPSHRQGDVDKELFLPSITSESHTMHFIKLGNFNFLFHMKVTTIIKQRISMVVQLIGTKNSASKWIYEVHVYNKREPRRKFYFTDRCASNRDALNDIFGTAKCAVLPFKYAETFYNEGSLAYKFYIKREEVNGDEEEVKEKVKRRYGRVVYKKNN